MSKSQHKLIHFRHRSFTTKFQHRKQHAIQHHKYLISLQNNKSAFPRYDILSQNNHNNLIVHVKSNNKQELMPKQQSQAIKLLQYQIKAKQQPHNTKSNQEISSKTKNIFYLPNTTHSSRHNNSQRTPNKLNTTKLNYTSIATTQKWHNSNLHYEKEQDKAQQMQERIRRMYLAPLRTDISTKKTKPPPNNYY